jgi:hypothetical protein
MRAIRQSGSMSGMWKRSHGRIGEGTARRKGRLQICSTYSHRVTSRLYAQASPKRSSAGSLTAYLLRFARPSEVLPTEPKAGAQRRRPDRSSCPLRDLAGGLGTGGAGWQAPLIQHYRMASVEPQYWEIPVSRDGFARDSLSRAESTANSVRSLASWHPTDFGFGRRRVPFDCLCAGCVGRPGEARAGQDGFSGRGPRDRQPRSR